MGRLFSSIEKISKTIFSCSLEILEKEGLEISCMTCLLFSITLDIKSSEIIFEYIFLIGSSNLDIAFIFDKVFTAFSAFSLICKKLFFSTSLRNDCFSNFSFPEYITQFPFFYLKYLMYNEQYHIIFLILFLILSQKIPMSKYH